MRKSIAFLLIALLMIGLIPAAFADGDVPTEEPTNTTQDPTTAPTEPPQDDNQIIYNAVLYSGEENADQNMKTIRDAFALAEEGKQLTVKIAQPGTYYVGDGRRAWRMRSNTIFDLNGATLIRYGSQGNILQNCDYTGENGAVGGYHLTDNITVRNGTINGAGETAATLNLCNIGHATGVHFENMNFRNGTSHLVEFSGCQNVTVKNCTFSVFAPGRDDNVEALQFDISDNDVSATAWNGVYLSDSTACRNVTVEGCTFYDFPTAVGNHKGIKNNHISGVVVKNCTFLNTTDTHQPAAWFYNFDNSEFSGNTITGNYKCGLNVSGCRNTVIKDNTINLKNAETGLYITQANSYVRGTQKDVTSPESCENLTVNNNTITVSGTGVGIRFYMNSGISEFNGNAVSATGEFCVTCSSGSHITYAKNNTIKAPNGIGLMIATKGQIGELSGNSITAKSQAIQITSESVVTTIKNQPLVTSAEGSGIFVSNATAKNIIGNTIKNCGSDGVTVSSTGVVSGVTNNTVTGCKEYGVRINNGNIQITFSGNTLTGNKTAPYKVNASILLSAPVISSLSNAYGGVAIKWNNNGGAKFRVYTKSGGAWKALADTAATSYVDSKAISGTNCTYTVRTLSADGKKYTSSYNTTGKTIYYVAAPRISQLENLSSGTRLTWKASKGVAKYRVFAKTGSAGWTTIANTTSTTCTYAGLKSGVTYIYTVRGIDANGKYIGAYNTAGWKYTFIAAPALPTLKNTKSGVQITYKKPAGGVYFRIFRKTGSGKWAKLADTSSTTYVDKTAKNGYKYAYTLRCISKDAKQYLSAYNTAGRAITCKR